MNKRYSNEFIWWLFASYALLIASLYITNLYDISGAFFLVLFFFVTRITLIINDRSVLKKLKNSDVPTKGNPPWLWTILITPIYLYQRARFLKTKQFHLLIWFFLITLKGAVQYIIWLENNSLIIPTCGHEDAQSLIRIKALTENVRILDFTNFEETDFILNNNIEIRSCRTTVITDKVGTWTLDYNLQWLDKYNKLFSVEVTSSRRVGD